MRQYPGGTSMVNDGPTSSVAPSIFVNDCGNSIKLGLLDYNNTPLWLDLAIIINEVKLLAPT